jgi:hypothetical protein
MADRAASTSKRDFSLHKYLKTLSRIGNYGASGEAGAFQPVKDRHG